MARYDRRLVRPSVHQLVEALAEASSRDRAFWHSVVEGIPGAPEGFEQWLGGGVVSLAWWTDAEGRRHFRVQGCREDDPAYPLVVWPEGQEMCPLWHVYPEHVVGRYRDGRADWLVLCDCGNGGIWEYRPWMGDRCLSCHKHPGCEAAVRPATGPMVSLVREGMHAKRLAFSGDSRTLAVAGKERWVDLWDVRAREYVRRLETGPTVPLVMAFTPGGEHLAVAGGDRTLRILNLTTGEEAGRLPTPKDLRQVVFAPGDRLVVMVGGKNTEIWDRPTHLDQRQLAEDYWLEVEHAAASPFGNYIALAAGEALLLLHQSTRGVVPHWMVRDLGGRFRRVAFRNGSNLVSVCSVSGRAKGKGPPYCETAGWAVTGSEPCWTSRHIVWAENAGLASEGDWLVRPQGCTLRFDETSGHKRCFVFNGDPRFPLTSVAFSPDERTLATTDEAGRVRLWPWYLMTR
jgi:WD40 repeat protein